ncbi:MAG: HEAT repeat domain-containing protein [Myxococcota bacterium]|nr:HEAT repeat domain-containing protein [Myxococcota bacterium]
MTRIRIPTLLLLLAIGCDGEAPAPAARDVAAPPRAPAAALPTEAAAAAEQRALAPPDRAGLALEVGDGGVTLRARDVSRYGVLRALGQKLRFSIVDWDGRDPNVSVELVEEPLEVVLGALLAGTPYSLHYGRTRGGEAALKRLVIGSEEDARRRHEVARAGAAEAGEDAPLPTDKIERHARRGGDLRPVRRFRPARSAEERQAALAARAEREAQRREENLELLDSEDAELRAEATGFLDSDEPADRARLAELLTGDPDARVRAEAARQLSFGAAESAAPALLAALGDPDPQVVVDALEALSWSEDPDVVVQVEPLLQHPDEKVRTQAEKTRWYLTRSLE